MVEKTYYICVCVRERERERERSIHQSQPASQSALCHRRVYDEFIVLCDSVMDSKVRSCLLSLVCEACEAVHYPVVNN